MLIICIHQGEKRITSGAYLEFVTLALHVTPRDVLKWKDAAASRTKCLMPEDTPDWVWDRMCYTTNSTARLPASHEVWLTQLAHTAAQRSLQVHFPSAHLGRGPFSWDADMVPSQRGCELQYHSSSAQPVNQHCSGWDHAGGQKQSPDLWRSKFKLYLLSYTSFCGRAEVPRGCFHCNNEAGQIYSSSRIWSIHFHCQYTAKPGHLPCSSPHMQFHPNSSTSPASF